MTATRCRLKRFVTPRIKENPIKQIVDILSKLTISQRNPPSRALPTFVQKPRCVLVCTRTVKWILRGGVPLVANAPGAGRRIATRIIYIIYTCHFALLPRRAMRRDLARLAFLAAVVLISSIFHALCRVNAVKHTTSLPCIDA